MSNVLLGIDVDLSVANFKVDTLQAKIDQQVADWRQRRSEIISQMQEVSMGIGLLIRGIRMAADATQTVLDPMQNALLSLVSSTTSIIVSTEVVLASASLGILTGVALGLAAFAYGMQTANTIKIMANYESLNTILTNVNNRLRRIEETNILGGYLGGSL